VFLFFKKDITNHRNKYIHTYIYNITNHNMSQDGSLPFLSGKESRPRWGGKKIYCMRNAIYQTTVLPQIEDTCPPQPHLKAPSYPMFPAAPIKEPEKRGGGSESHFSPYSLTSPLPSHVRGNNSRTTTWECRAVREEEQVVLA
jgi:hypothetical protein